MASSKWNPIARIQKWMDTMAGQTFMQYAYSWGAAIVIAGTLFKLTHIAGANLMLFIGMGTEIFVFFIAAFERVTEKVEEPAQQGGVVVAGAPVVGEADGNEEAAAGASVVVAPVVGAPVVSVSPEALNASPEAMAAGAGLSAAAANLAAAGQAAAEAQLALSQLQNGGVNAETIRATDPAAVEEAVANYATELTELTEVLGRVKAQAARMSTDSEEMENLNRTLTGIATVYELQLRNISKQVSTIEQIDEQTRRMAQQIEELNNVYARMIKALTVNMQTPVVNS